MPCDTRLKPRQTIQQRAEEVRAATEKLNKSLAAGRVKVTIDKLTGAIAFDWDPKERDGITDNCAYRRLQVTGSAAAKMAIQRAEQLAGRSVNKQAVAQGIHSHDGGTTWHKH